MIEIARELVSLCRLFNAFEQSAVCCGDITVAQCVVMQDLLDGVRTVSELAGEARLSASAMTRLLDGLVERGWIRRTRNEEEDRRQVRVVLTEKGRTEALRLRELTGEMIASALRRLPAPQRVQVAMALRTLREAVTSVTEACCPRK